MNLLLRFIMVLIKIVYFILTPVYMIKYRCKKHRLPELQDPILLISAVELSEKIRKKELTSTQICNSYIRRIKEVNPILNAVVEERFESALQEARYVDEYLQTATPPDIDKLEKTKPLLGVPVTVKESCSAGGLSLSVGTLSRRGIKADGDGVAVARLRTSGAILLLVSNTPEICLSWESNNFITGRTNNPYDVSRSSGGSSGGEGALLGAGASLIGIGSDIAGSIRLPALFNGVFGHKPTPRIISIKGHFPYCVDETYANYLVIGPMARYARDLAFLTKILIEEDTAKILRLDEKVDLARIRIFYMEEEGRSIFLPAVQTEIKTAIRQSVEHFRKNCASTILDSFKFSELKSSCEIGGFVLYNDIKDIPNLLKAGNQNLFVEMVKSLLGLSCFTYNLLVFYAMKYLFTTVVASKTLARENEALKQRFINVLGEDGVLFYPTFSSAAYKHETFLFKGDSISYLMIFNTLGLPATHVPCGFDSNGYPIGIQIVAAPYQDRLCLAVAQELEKAFGGWKQPQQKVSN